MTSHRTPSRDSRVAPWQYLLGVAITGGIAAWEALRIASAQQTVPADWGAGVAWGAGAALAVPALTAAAAWVLQRSRRGDDLARGQRTVVAVLLGVVVEAVLVIVAFASSTGSKYKAPGHPYVTVSSFGVAGMAYVGTTAALLAVIVLIASWTGRARRRR